MRKETELFDDGCKTVRTYNGSGELSCIESFSATGELKAAIDYLYDDRGINVERVVRDSSGKVLRRLMFDDSGQERAVAIDTAKNNGENPVRWASMDGTEEGLDLKGQEKLGE